MSIGAALRDGLRRVNSAPAVLSGVYLLTVAVALPFAMLIEIAIGDSLGSSVAADAAATGVNYDWWQEFAAGARGLSATFTPSIVGFAAVLRNLTSLLDNQAHGAAIRSAGIAYGVLWLFLLGGVLDRYARQRPIRAAGFFSASGVWFFRFLRLAVIAWLAYRLLFGYLHPWLFDDLYGWLTHETTVERTAFFIRAALYLVFILLLAATVMVFDYAKVRAVVEDRRSMLGALVAGARFVRRHPGRTLGLYLANGMVFVLVLLAYALVAPGAGSTGFSMWAGFFAGQLFIAARLATKLLFYASAIALFQSELAHAGYTAAPQPVWPESPAAEAVGTVSGPSHG